MIEEIHEIKKMFSRLVGIKPRTLKTSHHLIRLINRLIKPPARTFRMKFWKSQQYHSESSSSSTDTKPSSGEWPVIAGFASWVALVLAYAYVENVHKDKIYESKWFERMWQGELEWKDEDVDSVVELLVELSEYARYSRFPNEIFNKVRQEEDHDD